MTITEVSGQFNISPDTLRYYERIGLMPPVKRNERGVRDYGESDFRLQNRSLRKCYFEKRKGTTITGRILSNNNTENYKCKSKGE